MHSCVLLKLRHSYMYASQPTKRWIQNIGLVFVYSDAKMNSKYAVTSDIPCRKIYLRVCAGVCVCGRMCACGCASAMTFSTNLNNHEHNQSRTIKAFLFIVHFVQAFREICNY